MDPVPIPYATIVPIVVGGTAGFIGGAVAALAQPNTLRRVAMAVIGGTGIGTCFAPVIVHGFSLPVETAGIVGFVGGVGVFGFVAGLQKISDRFGVNPETFLPSSMRDRIPVPPPPVDPPQPPPSGTVRKKKPSTKVHKPLPVTPSDTDPPEDPTPNKPGEESKP